MQAWLSLLRLDVSHDYYADGRARGLRFEPVADTLHALQRAGLAWRSDGASLHLYGPADALQGLETEDGGLAWRIQPGDDGFASSTHDPCRRPWQLLWLQGPDPGGAGELFAVPRSQAWARLAQLLTPAEQRMPPFALLWLPLATLRAGVAAGRPLRLHWRLYPRATVWKYCLHGDWPEPVLAIVDLSGLTDFGAPAPDRMDDGTPMLAIRSRGRLPLAQRSPQRLQLRSRPEPDGRADKVLIRRLPTPAAQFLAREEIDGLPAIVSEIHVHR